MFANTDGGVSSQTSETSSRPDDRSGTPRGPLPHHGREGLLEATSHWLLEQQQADGYWVGELEGDTILESEYVLLMTFIGKGEDLICVKACRYLKDLQLDEGGWAIYPGGPPDLSASVKAYFALKIVGLRADDPDMVRAREWILENGGAQGCNSFTRFYLALLGQIDYAECPSVPPELVLIPSKLGFSLSSMSAWTRPILVPLSIMSVHRPVRQLPPRQGIAELFRDDLPRRPTPSHPLMSWGRFFLGTDRVLKWIDRHVPRAWRKPGLSAAHRWMLDHFENTDGLGAIFPPMIYSVVALHSLGYAPNSAPVTWALRQLEDLLIEENGKIRVQPCVSPVWDTAIATIALADAQIPPQHPALVGAAKWLLEKEVRVAGDWQVRRPGVEPSGWHFQFQNERYPDIDDTAMVLLALQRTALGNTPEGRAATRRGLNWLLAMQNRDGGWAAFDVDIDNEILTQVPFADHNAMLDPSCADITARILELLGVLGYRQDHPAIAKALDYLWRTQEAEGCWYGRWGVNYIYGTWQVLQGLKALDFSMDHPRLQKAADWLESVQQPGGGWGESCQSYDHPNMKGIGEPTASQTAWALLGLVAAGRASSEVVERGIAYLSSTRQADGTWEENSFTGTGFPRVFYLKYHFYRVYFPLMAISRYFKAVGQTDEAKYPGAMAFRIPASPEPFDL